MLLFLFLAICYSCVDEDSFDEVIIQNYEENFEVSAGGPLEPMSSDSIPSNAIDSTAVSQTDSTEVSQTELAFAAIANAMPFSGIVPLEVAFTGSNSIIEKTGITYVWDFKDGSSSNNTNPSHTFNDPGVYDVTLTVTDDKGRTDTATLTITVDLESDGNTGEGSNECITNGGKADESGLKTWCWNDITLPTYSGSKGVSFSNDELVIDSECNENALSIEGDELSFLVDLSKPVPSWCDRDFNMRAEVRTRPWDVRNPLGTEEWFGWRYRFGDSYVINQKNQWKCFQIYPGPAGLSTQISFEIIHEDQFSGHPAGEIYIINSADSNKYNPSGVVPVAGQSIDIVVQVIWGRPGLFKVWFDGNLVYNKQVNTVSSSEPWGGNAKFGIYQKGWRTTTGVQESLDQGITKIQTYMGNLRMITRFPSDMNYGKDSYSDVVPR